MTGFICRRRGTSDIGMHKTQEVSGKLTKYVVLLEEAFAWSWFIVQYFDICQEVWI